MLLLLSEAQTMWGKGRRSCRFLGAFPLHVSDSRPRVSAKIALRLSANLPLGCASTVSLQTAACVGGCRPAPFPLKTGTDIPKLLPCIFPQVPTTAASADPLSLQRAEPFYRSSNAARWARESRRAGEAEVSLPTSPHPLAQGGGHARSCQPASGRAGRRRLPEGRTN